MVVHGPTMATRYIVKIAIAPDLDAAALRNDITSYLDEFDSKVSTYRDDSELAQFNASRETDWFDVSPETAQLIARSLEIARQTDGAFDPTITPLTQLWKFDRHEGLEEVPTDEAIAAARERMGHQHVAVRLEPPALNKAIPELELNLNAIAPGWAVDRLAEMLTERGLTNHMIDIGGEIRTSGRKSDGSPWRIGIERPADKAHLLQAAVPLDDASIATSGDYRNFYVVDGVRYGHTVDSRTGRPVTHGLASVSVIAPDCTTADALATALMVLGPDEGLALAERLDLAVWMLIRDEDGGISARGSTAFQNGAGRDLIEYVSSDAESGFATADDAAAQDDDPAQVDVGQQIDSQSSPWTTLLLGAAGFAIAIIGLAAGLILRGKSLAGSCGGLAGMKDERGNPICQSCSIPPEECDEFRKGVAQAAAEESEG